MLLSALVTLISVEKNFDHEIYVFFSVTPIRNFLLAACMDENIDGVFV